MESGPSKLGRWKRRVGQRTVSSGRRNHRLREQSDSRPRAPEPRGTRDATTSRRRCRRGPRRRRRRRGRGRTQPPERPPASLPSRPSTPSTSSAPASKVTTPLPLNPRPRIRAAWPLVLLSHVGVQWAAGGGGPTCRRTGTRHTPCTPSHDLRCDFLPHFCFDQSVGCVEVTKFALSWYLN